MEQTPFTYLSVCSGIEAATVAWHHLGWKPIGFAEIEEFPSAILAHYYPEVPNFGDMTRLPEMILRGEVEAPDLLVGGTPCFVAGTLILTKKGLTPIEEVCVGDEVLTHKNQWKRVLNRMSRDAQTVLVKGQGHPGLRTTEEHPFWARTKTRLWHNPSRSYQTQLSSPTWVDAKDLQGKFWATPSAVPELSVPEITTEHFNETSVELTDALFWFVGAWLGDGWLRTGKPKTATTQKQSSYVLLCSNKKHRSFIEDKLRAAKLTYTTLEERTTTRFQIANKALYRWLKENFGEYSSGKFFPTWSFQMKKSWRESLLQGYVFADGSVNKSSKCTLGEQRITTVNFRLVVGLRLLTASLGMSSSVTHNKPKRVCVIEGRTVSEQGFYTIALYDSRRSAFFEGGNLCGKVRSVTPTGEVETVYNIEVEDDNSYIADGIVVHNCQAFSIAGLRNSLEDERGNLTLTFIEIANAIDTVRATRGQQPCILLWENVPGVYSTKDNAFGCFLGGLVGEDVPLVPSGGKWSYSGLVLGPQRSIAWRTLDAQYFGVAQRRRRCFLIASAREGFNPTEVLFEFDGVRRDSPPSRKTGQGTSCTVAPSLTASNNPSRSPQSSEVTQQVAAVVEATTAYQASSIGGYTEGVGTLRASGGDMGGGSESIVVGAFSAGQGAKAGGIGYSEETSPTLKAEVSGTNSVPTICTEGTTYALPGNWIGRKPENGGNQTEPFVEVSPCMTAMDRHAVVTPVNEDGVTSFMPNNRDPHVGILDDVSPTLKASNNSQPGIVDSVPFREVSDCLTSAYATKWNGNASADNGSLFALSETENKAFAFDSLASNSMKSSNPVSGCNEVEVAKTLDTSVPEPTKNQGGMAILSANHTTMAVRRLTPVECERLQGFPETKKSVTIVVCLDPQKNPAPAENQSPKLLNVAGSVEKTKLPETVLSAVLSSPANSLETTKLVAVNVLLNLEAKTLEIHSQEKLPLSVSPVEGRSKYPHLLEVESTAQLLVQLLSELERRAKLGKEESLQNVNLSLYPESGNLFVGLSGQEIEEHANDADSFTRKTNEYTKSITSVVGQSSQNLELNLKTLCCFVMAAINSYIPKQTHNESFYVVHLSISHGYTNIPWKKKTNAPDSLRYKALGNSMAVPVMRWIGTRIARACDQHPVEFRERSLDDDDTQERVVYENHPSDARVTELSPEEPSPTMRGKWAKGDTPLVVEGQQVYENHPADSRVTEVPDGEPCPTVTSRWGTGGGNVPYVLRYKILTQ